MTLTSRLARRADVPALLPLIDAAIAELQKGFLDETQIESSRSIMGIDTQLIDDGTYFVVEVAGRLAGCGGWSRRPPSSAVTTHRAGIPRCSTRPKTRQGYARCSPTPTEAAG